MSDQYADCIKFSTNLLDYTKAFIKKQIAIASPFIPLYLVIEAGIDVTIDLNVALCFKEKLLVASLPPMLTPFASVGLEIDIFILQVGLRLRVRLITLGLIPTFTIGLTPAGAIRLCFAMDFALRGPDMTFEGYVSFFICIRCRCCPIKIGFIRLPKCELYHCNGFTWPIFIWKPFGDRWFVYPLFEICNLKADTTSPELDSAFVRVKQIDQFSVNVEFGGGYDPEARIDRHALAIGSRPQAQDIHAYIQNRDITQHTFSDLDCPGEDITIFATVVYINSENLESAKVVPFICDTSAPEVVDLQVQDTLTQEYFDFTDFQSINETSSLRIRFKIVEQAAHSAISIVRYSVGSQPGLSDVSGKKDVGHQRHMMTKSTEWYYIVVSGLELQHRQYYFVNVETANSLGSTAMYSSHPIFVDQTPAFPTYISESAGRRNWDYSEDVTIWGSTDYLSLGWDEFDDAEGSPVVEYKVNLLDVTDNLWKIADNSGATPHRSVGTAKSYTFNLPAADQLQEGHTYKYSIIAVNQAGMIHEYFSNGFVSDPSAAEVHNLHISKIYQGVDHRSLQNLPVFSSSMQEQQLDRASVILNSTRFFSSDLDIVHVRWQSWDTLSGIRSISIGFGPSPGSAAFLPWTKLDTQQQEFVAFNIPAAPHTPFFASLKIMNGARNEKYFVSNQMIYDITPPEQDSRRRFFDCPWTGVCNVWTDVKAQAETHTLTATWFGGFVDPHSYISHYEVFLVKGAQFGHCMLQNSCFASLNSSVMGPVRLPPAIQQLSWNTSAVVLEHGQTYITLIRCYNFAGLFSQQSTSGVVIDLSPPVGYYAFDGSELVSLFPNKSHPLGDMQYQREDQTVFGTWPAFTDTESSMFVYHVFAESSNGTRLSRRLAIYPSGTETQFSAVVPLYSPVHSGQTIIFCISGTNGAGLQSTVTTNGVQVDSSGPAIVNVSLHSDGLNPEAVSSVSDRMILRWTVTETISPLYYCRVSVGTFPGGNDVASEITVFPYEALLSQSNSSEQTFLRTRRLSDDEAVASAYNWNSRNRFSVSHEVSIPATLLPDGVKLYSFIHCANQARSFSRRAPVEALLVDMTPPISGIVLDGMLGSKDVDFQHNLRTIVVNWQRFYDYGSGISHFEVCAAATGSTNPCSGLGPVRASKWARMAILTSEAALMDHTKYVTTVRAVDFAGHVSEASSNGIMFDSSPPSNQNTVVRILHDTTEVFPVKRTFFIASLTQIALEWSGFEDRETGIVGIQLAVGQLGDATSVRLPFNIGNGNTFTITGLDLRPNLPYFVTIRALNAVGLQTNVSVGPIIVDATPPLCTVLDGSSLHQDGNFFSSYKPSLQWDIADPDSGISSLLWAVSRFPGGQDMIPFAPLAPLQLQPVTNHDLLLPTSEKFFNVLKVRNGAGVWAICSSDGFIIDDTPPQVDFILDGVRGPDGDFHGNESTFAARFRTFDAQAPLLEIQASLWYESIAFGRIQAVQASEAVLLHNSAALAEIVVADATSLENGRLFFVQIQVTNAAGLKTTARTNGVIVDLTPPQLRVSNERDAFLVENEDLVVCWTSYDEYGIESSQVRALRHVDGRTEEVQPWIRTNIEGCWNALGVLPKHGSNYSFEVQSFNFAGLQHTVSSALQMADFTSPTVESLVLLSASGTELPPFSYLRSGSAFKAKWGHLNDPESGVVMIECGLGLAQGATDLLDFREVYANQHECGFESKDLPQGASVFATIRVWNGANRFALLSAPPVTFDKSAPFILKQISRLLIPKVTLPILFKDQALWPASVQGASVEVNLRPVTDPQSGIQSISVSLSSNIPDAFDSVNAIVAGTAARAIFNNLTVYNGMQLQVSIVATNQVGILSAPFISLVHVVSTQTIAAGAVYDGSGDSVSHTDIAFWTKSAAPSCSWANFQEPRFSAALLKYKWCFMEVNLSEVADAELFAARGCVNGKAMRDAGNNNFGVAHDFSLNMTGRFLVCAVLGTNPLGQVDMGFSTGATVDLTPPVLSTPVFRYSNSTEIISGFIRYPFEARVEASAYDHASGLSCSLGLRIPGAQDIHLGAKDSLQQEGIFKVDGTALIDLGQFSDGNVLEVGWFCEDRAGNSALVTGMGLVVDRSKPEMGIVAVDSAYNELWISKKQIRIRWGFSRDPHSSIVSIAVFLVRPNSSRQLLASPPAGSIQVYAELDLPSGSQFRITVEVTNSAGWTTTSSSRVYFCDFNPPSFGQNFTLYNSERFINVNFRQHTGTLTASWLPQYLLDEDSGIAATEIRFHPQKANASAVFTTTGLGNDSIKVMVDTSAYEIWAVSLRVHDYAGLSSEWHHGSLIAFDSFPPVFVEQAAVVSHLPADGGHNVTITTNISAIMESGSYIEEIKLAICEAIPLATTMTLSRDQVSETSSIQQIAPSTTEETLASLTGFVFDRTSEILQIDTDIYFSKLGGHALFICPASFFAIPTHAIETVSRILALHDGKSYGVLVQATDAVGKSAVAMSEVFSVDTSPPAEGVVFIADADFNPVHVLGSIQTVHAVTSRFIDPHSGIETCEWCFGLAGRPCSLLPWTPAVVGSTSLRAELPQGALNNLIAAIANSSNSYVVASVRCSNGARLITMSSSDPVLLDFNSPSGGQVDDISIHSDDPSTDIEFSDSRNKLACTWSGFSDVEPGTLEYEVCFGTRQGVCDVTAATQANGGKHTSNNVQLDHGITYYATVFVRDAALNQHSASSNGVTVAWDKPATPILEVAGNDGKLRTLFSPDMQILVSWTLGNSFVPISGFTFSVCELDRAECAVQPLMLTANQTKFSIPASILNALQPHSISIAAISQIGQTSFAASVSISIDDTPPVIGKATLYTPISALSCNLENLDGSLLGPLHEWNQIGQSSNETRLVRGCDMVDGGKESGLALKQYLVGLSPLTISWTNMHDKQSGISSFIVSAGSLPGLDDIYSSREVSRSLTSTTLSGEVATDLQQMLPMAVYVSVRAINFAALTSEAAVASAILLARSPTPSNAFVKIVQRNNTVSILNTGDLVSISWGGFDLPSEFLAEGSSQCQQIRFAISAGSGAGLDDVMPYSLAGTSQNASVAGSIFSGFDNQQVYVNIRAFGCNGLFSTVSSESILVTAAGPQITMVSVSFTNSTEEDSLSIHSTFIGGRPQLSIRWSMDSNETTELPTSVLESCSVRFCNAITASTCDPTINWAYFANVSTSLAQIAGIEFTDGTAYVAIVRCVTVAGTFSEGVSPVFTVDATPPLIYGRATLEQQANNSARSDSQAIQLALASRKLAASDASLPLSTLTWHEEIGIKMPHIVDSESWIQKVEWCVGTSVQSCNVAPKRSLSPEQLTVAMQQQAVILESLPAPETIQKLVEDENSLAQSRRILRACDFQATSADGCEKVRRRLALQQNGPVVSGHIFAHVWVSNGAGLGVELSTDALAVDFTPPAAGIVEFGFISNDAAGSNPLSGVLSNSSDTVYLKHSAEIGAHWSLWLELQSEIVGHVACIVKSGSAHAHGLGGCIPRSTTTTNTTSVQFTPNILEDSVEYKVVVWGVNSAGLLSNASSNNIVVDGSPPVFSNWGVIDGDSANATDIEYINADDGTIEAVWSQFEDSTSGMSHYLWTVMEDDPQNPLVSVQATGEDSPTWMGSFQMFDWIDVGLNTSAYMDNLPLRYGFRYRSVLRAYNKAGRFTEVLSDGVVLRSGEPCISNLGVGNDIHEDAEFLTFEDSIFAHWQSVLDPFISLVPRFHPGRFQPFIHEQFTATAKLLIQRNGHN